MKNFALFFNLVLMHILTLHVLSALPYTRQQLLMDYNRKFIQADVKDQQSWIEFDGVYMNCDVWINGQHLGNNFGSYIN